MNDRPELEPLTDEEIEQAQLASLTEKQAAFAQAVARGVRQREAAIQAGYSAHTADSIASRLMRQEKVQTAISILADREPANDVPYSPDAIRKLLWAIAKTGTPAARVSALQALDRMGSRHGAEHTGVKVMEEYRDRGPDAVFLEVLQRVRRMAERRKNGKAQLSPETRTEIDAIVTALSVPTPETHEG